MLKRNSTSRLVQLQPSRQNFYNSTALGATLGAVLLSPSFPCVAQSAADTPPSGPPPATAESAQTKNPEAIVDELVVSSDRRIVGGLMKEQIAAETMSSVTAAAIAEKISAGSPLQLAATIPGVNFGSSDAYGLTHEDFLSVRGLDETELGFLIEGIPGNDLINYFPYSETWADSENISDITLTPGNSRLQDPIVSASGGEFIESIRAPRDTFGGLVSGSAGSYDGWRTFVDVDTGYIGQTGAKAFLSYSYTSAGNSVGPGTNTRDHVDFKVVEDWSPKAHSSLFVSYNYWLNARLPILSYTQAKNGIATNSLEQYQYSSTFIPGVTTNDYKAYISPRTNYLVASNNDMELTDRVTLHITPYFRYNYSNSPGETAIPVATTFAGNEKVTPVYNPASLTASGKLLTEDNLDFLEHQVGVSTYLEANVTSGNLLMVGYWHEEYHVNEASTYSLLTQNGGETGSQESTALYATNGALITGTNWAANTTTDQIFVGDTQSMLDDKLQISAGLKNLFYSVNGTNKVIGAPPAFSANWSRLMPRLLVSYDIDSSDQIYTNVTTNARMPAVQGTYPTDFSVTTGGFAQVGQPNTKPEYSVGEQIGYRHHGPVNVDGNVFYMNLANHQVSSLAVINGATVASVISAGGETIRGASLEVSTHSYDGFSVYGNTQYLYGTFDNDVAVGGNYLPTKGKQMVESPNWIATVGGRYENGSFFAQVTGKYVASQYSTFMNDQSMPAYETVDLALGYHLPEFDALKEPVIRLNINNLGNKPYISSVASVAENAVATKGVNGTTIAPTGATSYYVAAPLAFMVTLSSKF
jgi:iron complex outermembrane receptor protein